jgi:hypothetical protein
VPTPAPTSAPTPAPTEQQLPQAGDQQQHQDSQQQEQHKPEDAAASPAPTPAPEHVPTPAAQADKQADTEHADSKEASLLPAVATGIYALVRRLRIGCRITACWTHGSRHRSHTKSHHLTLPDSIDFRYPL